MSFVMWRYTCHLSYILRSFDHLRDAKSVRSDAFVREETILAKYQFTKESKVVSPPARAEGFRIEDRAV